jgi:lipid A 3-O-deacylase
MVLMKLFTVTTALILMVTHLATGSAAYAAEPASHLALVAENDVFGGRSDRHYSSGIRIDWAPKRQRSVLGLGKLMQRMMPVDDSGSSQQYFSLGQDMHSPEDISATQVVVDDVPYAGWLYVTAGHVRNTSKFSDRLAISLGVIGPMSLAGGLQRFWHKAFNFNEPRGWRNELRNEPGLVLFYERRWKMPLWRSDKGYSVLLAPHGNISLGNIFTYVGGGLSLRFGRHVSADTALPRIQPGMFGSASLESAPIGHRFAWYVYVATEGRAVARNIFLDGNSFRDSHSVDKKTFVGDVSTGIVMLFGRQSPFRMSYSFTWRSREFHGQNRIDKFGSITLSMRY